MYPVAGNLYLLATFIHFIPSLPPACGSHQSVLHYLWFCGFYIALIALRLYSIDLCLSELA